MSYIVWSRKCNKCKGQFYLEDNEDGAYLVCIQCGYTEKIVENEISSTSSSSRTNKSSGLVEVK